MNKVAEFTKNIVDNTEHKEGPVAKAIEQQTAKLPSDTFLWLAVGSMVASAALQVSGKKNLSTFVGQWAPALLILGLYNKLVKLEGSDRTETSQADTEYLEGRSRTEKPELAAATRTHH